MIFTVMATELEPGMVLALPMGRTAKVSSEPLVGTKFVTFKTNEHGESRISRHEEVLIEIDVDEERMCDWMMCFKSPIRNQKHCFHHRARGEI